MYEQSLGQDSTSELAVMCDTFKPLRPTSVAAGHEIRTSAPYPTPRPP